MTDQQDHTTYLTPEGHQKLLDEYEDLKSNKIPAIASRIDEARQQGDLSENAEYHVAREDMSWAQTRLVELEETLRHVKIIKQSASGNNKVRMGSTVTVKTGGKERTYRIVGIQEADPAQGFISHESPLAQSLMGCVVGDDVTVAMPAGKMVYKVTSVE